MKHTSTLRLISLLFLFLFAIQHSKATVTVVPIDTEIDNSAFHHFRQGLRQAHESGSSMLVLHLNTYGGALDAADSIRTTLMRLDMPTVAFVDVNAASAGALIALACDTVFMAPGASMGSATVVNGAGEPMPEKYQSYMSTIMRATAEHHGKKQVGDSMVWRRSPSVAESMVNPDISVSLTTRQAIENGYADGSASSIAEVLANLDRADEPIEYYRSTVTDDILGFLSNAAVRAILVMLILGGIYMEMHTPGLGVAAAVASVATVLYFVPMFVAGAVPAWVLLCFIAGIVLIALEVFVVPGFGVCGISGIIAVALSLVGGILSNDAVTGFDMTAVGHSVLIVGIGCLLAVALVWYLTSSHGPECFRKHSELMTELSVDKGFVGVDMSPARLVGETAKAVTVLRPAGKIEVNGVVYDAVSTGEFIPSGHSVKIMKYENAQLYVAVQSPDKQTI